jgi:hypothetical protein
MDKKKKLPEKAEETRVFGNPDYPASEDIYSHDKKQSLTEKKDAAGNDLDVPGSELDDKDELIGEEDEENNYYSLGGDDHQDLKEDQGD